MWLLPLAGHCGAWPQEKRALFLAYSNGISAASDNRYATNTSLYLEYGLTPRMTLGIDGYLGPRGTGQEGYVFLRFPIAQHLQKDKLAVTLALGRKTIPNPWGAAIDQPQAKIGLSWGRGLKRGWLAVDAFAIVPFNKQVSPAAPAFTGHHNPHFSIDFTWGFKPHKRLMLITQLQTGQPANGKFYAKLAPSLVWAMDKEGHSQIEIGLVKGLVGDRSEQVKIGMWRRF
ncbi:MAG: hypothetical protein CSA68_09710 [Rhodobacterales bacterium]|nr:MAG: hypothetical protein CSA68_09710 [Rhodobacterales bacterium]